MWHKNHVSEKKQSSRDILEYLEKAIVAFFTALVPTFLVYFYPYYRILVVPIGSGVGVILGILIFNFFTKKHFPEIDIKNRLGKYFWFIAFTLSNTYFLCSAMIDLNDMGVFFILFIGTFAGSLYIWFLYIQWRLGLITRLFIVLTCFLQVCYALINSIPLEKIFSEIFLFNYALTYFIILFMTPLIRLSSKIKETIDEEAFYASQCHFLIVFSFAIFTFTNALVISIITLSALDVPEVLSFFVFGPAITGLILVVYFRLNPRSMNI